MKAKRLLAAFMAVAIVATTLVTLSTVSFAATQTIFPEVKVTLEPTGTAGKYTLSVILANYGTLEATDAESYAGTKLAQWQVDFELADGAIFSAVTTKSLKSPDITTIKPASVAGAVDTSNLTLMMGNTSVDTYFPYDESSYSSDEKELILATVPVTIDKEAFTLKVTSVLVQMGAVNADTGALVPAEDMTLNNCSYAYGKEAVNNKWPQVVTATEKIVIGEVVSDEPVIEALPEGDKTGVAINGQENAKYDNAYATTASFSNLKGILQAGILFVPKAVIDKAGVAKENVTATDDKYEVALAYDKKNAAVINGTYEVQAALIGIPRALNNVELVTVPYVKGDAGYTYGDASTVQLNFGNTGAKQ